MSSLPHPGQNSSAARQLHIQGVDRLRYGDLDGARRLLQQALTLDPASAESHYQLGNCLRRQGQVVEAEASLKEALERDPNLTPAWFSLAFMYAENGRRTDAADILSGLVKYSSGNLEVQHKAGGLMGELGLFEQAAEVYGRIIELEPQSRNHLRLGQYLQKMGRYTDAAQHLTRAIELNPDAGAAYLLLANTRRFSTDATDQALIRLFEAALQRSGLSSSTQACINFALGKMHDDLDDCDRAFACIDHANRLRQDGPRFVAAEWLDTARQIEELQASDIAAGSAAPTTGKAPVFVVGMLRSGTTLAERTLARHPQAIGLGEASWLQEAVGHAVADTGLPFPACLVRLREPVISKLREEYLRHWPKDAPVQANYMVDKNPINFLYLGLVARVFPEAKIVHCRRDARDTGLSIYFQNFANQDNTYAYELGDIAQFHNGYARIMRHWEKLLPAGMLHNLDYEDMVKDQEGQIRRLLGFLGLPWDDACLDFHKQDDGIATASVWQARQPLYSRSVGRWQHYAQHLGPLLQNLSST